MRVLTLLAWSVLCALALPTAADAQRMPDSDVKRIIDAVDHARDRFEDALPGKFKDSILRGATGEVSVGRYLDDLQENAKKLKDRFSDRYAASAEVDTLLRQGMQIDAYMKSQPNDTPAASEWDRMALELNRLAEAYGTKFPIPPGGTVRRMNDAEVAQTADAIAKGGDQLKKAFHKETTLSKDDRAAIDGTLDAAVRQAKTVKSRASDSTPASAEARQLFDLLGKVDTFTRGRTLQPATMSAWGGMRSSIEKLQQAFTPGVR